MINQILKTHVGCLQYVLMLLKTAHLYPNSKELPFLREVLYFTVVSSVAI